MKHLGHILRLVALIGAIEFAIRALLGPVVFGIVVSAIIASLFAAYCYLAWKIRRRS